MRLLFTSYMVDSLHCDVLTRAMRSCAQTSRCVLFRKSSPPLQLFDNPPLPNEASLGGALVALNCCSTSSAVLTESGRIFIWGQNIQTSGILDGDQLFPGEQAAGCSLFSASEKPCGSFCAAPQAPGMHSPLYEMMSLPMPVSDLCVCSVPN